MSTFAKQVEEHADEMAGDICDLLLSFTDFAEFKSMMLAYRAEREGTGPDLDGVLVQHALTPAAASAAAMSTDADDVVGGDHELVIP